MNEEKKLVRIELEVPKEVYSFLMLSLGDEERIREYFTHTIVDNIESDFDSLKEGGPFATYLYDRYRDTILKSLKEWGKQKSKM